MHPNYSLYKSVFLSAIVAFLLASCGDGNNAPDVNGIKVDIDSRRLDKDLLMLDTNHLGEGLKQLSSKYPDFLNFYLDTLIGYGIKGVYEDSSFGVRTGLKGFLTSSDYRGVFDSVAVHFPDTKDIDEQLKHAFQYMKHYDPGATVPKVIYLVSGFSTMAFTYDTTIVGIGLDMFLGGKYPVYASVGIPDYVAKKLTPAYITTNVMQVLYREKHPFVMDGRTLLDMMIQRGKEQYYLSKVLPFVGDTIRLGYTQKQLDWCRASEAQIYNFFVKDQLLYETNWQKILRYVNDGPTSAGMPAESPGNIANWIGLQIVKSYAAEHPEMSLTDILKPIDAQTLLLQSKYKPK